MLKRYGFFFVSLLLTSRVICSDPGKWVAKNREMINLYKRGQFKESLDFALPGYKILKKKFRDEKKISSDATMFLVNYGVIALKSNRFKQAENILNFARESKLMIASPNDPLFVIIYKNLAKVNEFLKDSNEAEKNYLEAINVKMVNRGEESIELVPIYVQLGNFYQLTNNQKAQSVYEKALILAKKNTGDEGILTADIHLVLGKYLLSANVTGKAREQLTTALDIYNKNDSKNKIAHTYDALGLLSQNLKDYLEAESYYRLALKHKKLTVGESSLEYAKTLNNLGTVYLYQNKNEAESVLKEAMIIVDKKQKDHPSLQLIIQNLVEFYERKNNREKAAEYRKKLS